MHASETCLCSRKACRGFSFGVQFYKANGGGRDSREGEEREEREIGKKKKKSKSWFLWSGEGRVSEKSLLDGILRKALTLEGDKDGDHRNENKRKHWSKHRRKAMTNAKIKRKKNYTNREA